jgi:hypothetical protein
VENAFANLKLMFKELSQKTTMNLKFVPDMIYACCILHNILFEEKDVHVQELLRIITLEAGVAEQRHRRPQHVQPILFEDHDAGLELGEQSGDPYRMNVEIYLGLNQRPLQ